MNTQYNNLINLIIYIHNILINVELNEVLERTLKPLETLSFFLTFDISLFCAPKQSGQAY